MNRVNETNRNRRKKTFGKHLGQERCFLSFSLFIWWQSFVMLIVVLFQLNMRFDFVAERSCISGGASVQGALSSKYATKYRDRGLDKEQEKEREREREDDKNTGRPVGSERSLCHLLLLRYSLCTEGCLLRAFFCLSFTWTLLSHFSLSLSLSSCFSHPSSPLARFSHSFISPPSLLVALFILPFTLSLSLSHPLFILLSSASLVLHAE